jgi:hypothetical protein
MLSFLIKIPNGDNNTPEHQENMRHLRDLIIRGIRESVPRSQNLSKTFNVRQGKDGGPAEFMSSLKDLMRKYAGLALEDPLGQEILKFHFVTNIWPDITKKYIKIRELEK